MLDGIKLIILQKALFDVLRTTTIVEFGGKIFQLYDDGDLTRQTSQASSRKEILD